MLKQSFSALIGVVAFSIAATSQTLPPMGGGYTDVVSIPVTDPAIKAIAGSLVKPTGAGPFPAVIYLSGCGGLSSQAEKDKEKGVIEHFLAKGVAILIVDPFTARNEPDGVCANLDEKRALEYFTRGGNDALAALSVLKAMPDIDPNRIFFHGYSFGAISALMAADTKNPASHDAKLAGIIAYYPYCYDGVDPSVPVLVMIGEKDDWTPAAKCQAVTGKADFEVVVYPGDTHAFTMNFGKPVDYLGHHFDYDEKATLDGQLRADAFITAHTK
jgi:dienelactone hydrolase